MPKDANDMRVYCNTLNTHIVPDPASTEKKLCLRFTITSPPQLLGGAHQMMVYLSLEDAERLNDLLCVQIQQAKDHQ